MARRKPAVPQWADRAADWIALWSACCPPDLRHLETRDKQHGGEFQFARKLLGRQWRFDWCVPSLRIAVEVDGGKKMAQWSPRLKRCIVIGHHNKDTDLEKHNAATSLGFYVFHFSPEMLSPAAVDVVVRLIRSKL